MCATPPPHRPRLVLIYPAPLVPPSSDRTLCAPSLHVVCPASGPAARRAPLPLQCLPAHKPGVQSVPCVSGTQTTVLSFSPPVTPLRLPRAACAPRRALVKRSARPLHLRLEFAKTLSQQRHWGGPASGLALRSLPGCPPHHSPQRPAARELPLACRQMQRMGELGTHAYAYSFAASLRVRPRAGGARVPTTRHTSPKKTANPQHLRTTRSAR